MFQSTKRFGGFWTGGAFVLFIALLTGGACATLDMPTPVNKVRTTNQKAPSYEYYPPPMPDASVPDAVVPDASAPGSGPEMDAGPN